MKKNPCVFIIFTFFLIFSWNLNSVSAENISKKNNFCFYKYDKDTVLLDKAVSEYVNSLPLSQQISQLFLVNVAGNEKYFPVEKTERISFCKNVAGESEYLVPGGVLLFSYNIGDSAEQLISYIDSINFYCKKNNICPPYISTDQEGGLVNRLYPLTSYLPSNQKVAEKLTLSQAEELYSFQAKQMSALGFHMNLSPVCESLLDSNKAFLGTRSYGKIPETIMYSIQEINAFEKNNVASVLKHFPGNTNTDPHSGLPEIKVTDFYAYKNFILPFNFILSQKPSAVLMSHARTAFLDEKNPACLSKSWVTDVLKNDLGFDGLIISDDIFMAALKNNGFDSEKAAVMTIEAGVHVIMLSEKTYAPVAETLIRKAENDSQFAQKIFEAQKKVIKYKIKCGILKTEKADDGTYSILQNDETKNSEELSKKFEYYKNQGNSFYNQYLKK